MDDSFYNHIFEIAIDKAEKALDISIIPDFQDEQERLLRTRL